MLIRILTSRDGLPCGAEVDIDDATARGWVSCGDAEPVTRPVVAPAPPQVDAVVLETAVADAPVETRKRGKK